MHTRSSNASSASSSSSQSYRSRQSLPSVLTRSRKRKSSVLQDDDIRSRFHVVREEFKILRHEQPICNHRSDRRVRHSLSSADLTDYMTSSDDKSSRRRIISRRPIRSHARQSLQLQRIVHDEDENNEVDLDDNVSSHYRRRLLDDYDNRSNVSSGSSAVSVGSSSVASYCTRLSSRRSQSDRESLVSGLSHISSGNPSQDETNNLGFRNGREQEGEVEEESENSSQYDDIKKAARPSPLPTVCFAACDELWELMCAMDLKYHKPPEIFRANPVLSPQMRAILIDWMMDVCEAYKMHRETLYLAVDYLDRYLASQTNIAKTVLQLIGITCLFVASKLEEIYPPKLKVFAYVTDGACTESEILDMELILMKTLKWKLTPITPVGWVSIYLQVLAYKNSGVYCTRSGADSFLKSTLRQYETKPDDNRLVKHFYDSVEFVRTMRLIDMALLDYQSLQFSYSTLATAALYHIKGRPAALSASGFKWSHIAPCVNWMAPFALVLKRNDIPSVLPSIDNVCDENRHLVQSHCVNLELVAEAERLRTSKISSPLSHTGLLTPPRSSEKFKKSLTNSKNH